ncbi:PREDICTED: protein ROOT HAIR DEFECTIVE 3 homolog 2-like [Populus euphratica]|uniref:Protein ROOT HAIR DEFECTIVE 3 homolog 2-like n=1 Tax=Populus euphratica TaxID=75702 RepID=A0AAJ6V2G0_POPEU|nr:PREDICTED: protein ROOT HAIR DEFECTIVE 3 homolog 2-like [Populus euphratica]
MEKGMQLIDGNGTFNVEGFQDFMTTTEFAQCGLSYSVVAIIGPQSSGKSTLMNHVFGTDFKMLNASKGRGQTTKGIWIAKSSEIEPFTIAMDLEGTDSSARGEDNTAFEKQSTLFALAIADTILVNMWCKDIGLEHAACRPLLKLVFQVMKRLFQPRKRTLLFVIRDHTRTPLEFLETALRKDIEKIWAAVAEPETHSSAALSDYFNVEITALSSYEFEEDKFKDQVAHLKQRFFNSNSPRDLASGFSVCAEKIWKTIKDNKDLHIPDPKVMAASVRCEEIAKEKLKQLTSDEKWLELKEDVQVGPVPWFGATLSSILATYLSQYDKEVIYFDQDVRNAKRRQLELNALEVVRDAYVTMLEHLSSKTLEIFKTKLEQLLNEGEGFVASARSCARSCLHEFDQGCKDAAIRQSEWNASNVREKLTRDMLSKMMAIYEEQLTDVLADELQFLFETGERDTWLSVRNLLESKTENAVSEFSNAVVGFKVHRSAIDTKLEHLRENARNVVKRKAKEAAAAERVLTRMKERFQQVFNRDEISNSRFWTREKNIDEIERNALSASLKILSAMAAVRLDKLTDQIEHLLFSSLMDESGDIPSSQRTGAAPDPLASNTWEEVSPNDTLLTPVECKSLWMEFKEDMMYKTNQARSDQEALRNTKRLIKIVVGVVGAAVITAVGVPAAMKIAARPEVAAVLKAVTTWLLAVLKYLGMEVWETLKYIGIDVLEVLKDAAAVAVRSLQPQIVAIIIALVTKQSDWRQQY